MPVRHLRTTLNNPYNMNRDLKFRAWTKEGRMQYDVVPWHWDFVIDTMSHKCIDSNGEGILGSGGTRGRFEVPGVAFVSIMQYTGLKDKNRKEVYEADILRGTLGSKMLVSWDNDEACYFMREKGGPGYTLSAEELRDHEVIGNAFENPELVPA